MKKNYLIIMIISIFCFVIGSFNLSGQSKSDNNTAQKLNLFGGYGTHGIVFGFNCRIATAKSGKSGTRLYLDLSSQGISFSTPIVFKSQSYNSDTRIMSFGGGIAKEYYLKPGFHLAPFIGVRFDDAHFKDSYINNEIGDGQLIRYWDGVEVGSRLSKDYGGSRLAVDIGGCFNIRIAKRFWLMIKVAVSPIKYDSNESMYGKYWADTQNLNDYAINRSIIRSEVTLNFGF